MFLSKFKAQEPFINDVISLWSAFQICSKKIKFEMSQILLGQKLCHSMWDQYVFLKFVEENIRLVESLTIARLWVRISSLPNTTWEWCQSYARIDSCNTQSWFIQKEKIEKYMGHTKKKTFKDYNLCPRS